MSPVICPFCIPAMPFYALADWSFLILEYICTVLGLDVTSDKTHVNMPASGHDVAHWIIRLSSSTLKCHVFRHTNNMV